MVFDYQLMDGTNQLFSMEENDEPVSNQSNKSKSIFTFWR